MFLSDVETDSWPPGLLDELAARSARWLITRGEFGAHEYAEGASVHLPPEKASPMHLCLWNEVLKPSYRAVSLWGFDCRVCLKVQTGMILVHIW